MLLNLGKLALFLAAVSSALAQTTYVQLDTFHVGNCSSPCTAQLALTQNPVGPVTLFINWVQLTPDLYQIDSSNGPTLIIVTMSSAIGALLDTDVIVASYPAVSVSN